MKQYTNGINLVVEEQDEQIKLEVENFQQVITGDYNKLKNKPSINNVELVGNKSSEELDLVSLTKYKKEQLEQDNSIQKNAENLTNYKIDVSKEQKAQDTKITKNSTDIADLIANLDNYKLSQEKRDKEQDIALNEYKQVVAKEQEAQDAKIKQNTTDINGVSNSLEDYKKVVDLKNAQQDASIQANTENFANYYDKAYIDKSQKSQDTNIQNNSLGLLGKVDEDTYIKDQLAQNQNIQNNKSAIEANKESADLGIKEAKDLANTKAVIDDTKISGLTTMSSYELASRLACEKTLSGPSVTFNPIEGYPISAVAEIKFVRTGETGDISGWDNIDITQDNGGSHKVYNQELEEPCFGGAYEPHKGKLTITDRSKFFNGEEDWKEVPIPNGRKHMFTLTGAITNASNDVTKQFSNDYKTNPPIEFPTDFDGVWIKDNVLYIGGGVALNYSLTEWKQHLASNNMQIVYSLAKAETQLYPQLAINAQSGTNTMYANSGNIQITTRVMPLCDGEQGVSKDYVDTQDNKLQEQITQNKDDIKTKANLSDIKTKLSELENDVPFATTKSVETMGTNTLTSAKTYTNEQTASKADKEWVIDELAKKANDVDLPTDVSQLNNDAQYQTLDQVKALIQGLGNVFEFKGAKAKRSDLDLIPEAERTIGDVWFVEDESVAYIWLEDSTGLRWEKFGQEIDLTPYFKKSDILDSTGTNTDKVMSQNAVTEALKLKADKSELSSKQDKLSNEQLTNINNVPNKADKDYVDKELLTKANKDYVDKQLDTKANTSDLAKKQDALSSEQLNNINDIPNKANKSDLKTNLSEFINDANFVDSKEVEKIVTDKGYLNAEQVKTTKVDNAVKADTADTATNANQLGGNDASDYPLKLDLVDFIKEPKEIALNANLTLIRGWYKTNGDTANLPFETPISDKVGFLRVIEYNHDSRDVLQIYYCYKKKVLYLRYFANAQPQEWFALPSINDKDRNGLLSTYSAKQIETILASPQYSVLVVQVSPRGSGGYQADKTALEIKQYIDASGLVILKHEDQIYEYQKYDANDAVFFRVDVSNDKVEEIDIRVQYDKNINIVRTPYGINEAKVNELIDAKGYATTKYVDDSIKQAILDSWGGSY